MKPLARIVNDGPDPDIVAAFGDCVLPTAFTLKASARVVREEVQRLNPNHVVFTT